MSHTDSFQDTLPHRRVDPDATTRRQAEEETVRHAPVQPPAQPPSQPPARRRKRKPGCVGQIVRLGLLAGAMGVIGAAILLGLYWFFPPPRTTILVMGLDARAGQGVQTRSDVMMLITVDPAGPYLGMLSLPRDLYLNVPGYGFQRINAANVLGEGERIGGGPALAARTVEENFGIPVHKTVRLDFQAFVAIIDAAGGVSINVPESFIDYEYPTADYGTMVVEFRAGVEHMDGERALQYARIRHGSSDFARAARQQQIVRALAGKLVLPWHWPRIPLVTLVILANVDTDLNPLDIALIAPAVLLNGGQVDNRVLDRNYVTGITTDAGASVQQPNWDAIRPLVDEMFR